MALTLTDNFTCVGHGVGVDVGGGGGGGGGHRTVVEDNAVARGHNHAPHPQRRQPHATHLRRPPAVGTVRSLRTHAGGLAGCIVRVVQVVAFPGWAGLHTQTDNTSTEFQTSTSLFHLQEMATEDRQSNATWIIFIFLLLKKYHFIIPFVEFGPPYLGKATAAARAVLPSPTID